MPAPSSGASSGLVSDAPQPALSAPPAVAARSQAGAVMSASTEQHQDMQLQQQEAAALGPVSDSGAKAVPILVLSSSMPPRSERGIDPAVQSTAAAAAAADSDEASSSALARTSGPQVTGSSAAAPAAVDWQAAAQVVSSGAGAEGCSLPAAAEQPAADAAPELDAASSGTEQPQPGASDAEGSTAGGGDSVISI